MRRCRSVVYADADGHIGFVSPALLPRRKAGGGWLPRPGWTGEFDWDGFAPLDALPRALDPPSGRLLNGNNRVGPDSFPVFVTRDWDAPYRGLRIGEILTAAARHDAGTMEAILADPVSGFARAVVARLDRVTPGDEPARLALERLRAWDGSMTRDRPEPLIFHTWIRELQRALFDGWRADELGGRGMERPEVVLRALDPSTRLLPGGGRLAAPASSSRAERCTGPWCCSWMRSL